MGRSDKPTTTASKVTVSYGIFQFSAALKSPKKSQKAVTLTSACPECPTRPATKLSTQFVCEFHGPIERDRALKAQDDGGELVVVGTADEVAAAKEQVIQKDVCELIEYFADEVEANTYPGESRQVIVPNGPAEFYAALRQMVGENGRFTGADGRDRVLLTDAQCGRSGKKLYRVQTWNEHLVLQELMRPEDIHEMEPVIGYSTNDETVEMLSQFLSQGTATFDPETYANVAKANLAQFIESRKAGGVVIDLPKVSDAAPQPQGVSMAEQLKMLMGQKAS